MRVSKAVGMSALGKVLPHPELFHAGESAAKSALAHVPRFLLYNDLNPWGRHRVLMARGPEKAKP